MMANNEKRMKHETLENNFGEFFLKEGNKNISQKKSLAEKFYP